MEVKLPPFAQDKQYTYFYIHRNPKASTQKLFELINKFSKVCTGSLFENQLYFYTVKMNNLKMKLRINNSIQNSIKKGNIWNKFRTKEV